MKSLDYRPKRKRLRVDNAEDFDDYSVVATITKEEVKSIVECLERIRYSR